MTLLCQRPPPPRMLLGPLPKVGSGTGCCLPYVNTDACGRVFTICENGDPEVSGPSTCGMNDANLRMVPVFWAVFIMRP